MISIAILAILLAIPYTAFNTFSALRHERALHDYLHSARQQLAAARRHAVAGPQPEMGEAHRVPRQAPYRIGLAKGRVERLTRVQCVEGETRRDVVAKLDGDQVELPPACAGKVVVVDYVSADDPNVLRVVPLDAALHPTRGKAQAHLLVIEETSREPRLRLKLSAVAVP